MIIQLTTENVVDYWETIKYAVMQAHPEDVEAKRARYLRGVLVSLLTNMSQCWFVLSEDRDIKAVLLTRKELDPDSGLPFLLVNLAFGFAPTSKEDKIEFMDKISVLAKNMGCDMIRAYTLNQMAANAMGKMGMDLVAWVYSKEVSNGI